MSAPDPTTGVSPWAVDDRVWVYATRSWRRGRVLEVGSRRVLVDYLLRHSDGARGKRWFAERDGHPVLSGALSEPVITSCPDCKVKLVHGRPGQSEDDVIAEHWKRSPECVSTEDGAA